MLRLSRLLICFILLAAPFFAACGGPADIVGKIFFSPVSIGVSTYEAAAEKRDINGMANDNAIWTRIRATILHQAPVAGVAVSIYCFNGTVYLTGNVDGEMRRIAEHAARTTDGVRQVVTHWFPPESGDIVVDYSIAAALRLRMIADLALSSTQIETYTCGGDVLLLGVVGSPDAARRAEYAARAVAGVRSVKSYLIY